MSDKNFSESVMKQKDTNKEVAKMTSNLQHHKILLKEIKESFLIGDSMCKGRKMIIKLKNYLFSLSFRRGGMHRGLSKTMHQRI